MSKPSSGLSRSLVSRSLGRSFLYASSALISPALTVAFTFAPPAVTNASAQTAQNLPPITVTRPQDRVRRRLVAGPLPRQRVADPAPAEKPQGQIDPPPQLANSATVTVQTISNRSLSTGDSASLIADLPGGAAWGAGGVSSLPSINGIGADKNQVAINGMLISPACPNQMNPPLSFVNPSMIASMQAYFGAAPVSAGGDYIGSRVDVKTAPPVFATGDSGWLSTATLASFYRSNGNVYGVDATAMLANHNTNITYTGGWARATDYKAGDGTTVKSTMYEIQNHALSISKQNFGNLFTFQVGGQFIPYEGYVNQRMDMVFHQSMFVNGRYEGVFDWGKLEASAFAHQIRHTMNTVGPDKTFDMPMDTKGIDGGYSLKATVPVSNIDLVRVGNELQLNRLDDWWPPVNGMSPNMGPNGPSQFGGGGMAPNTFVSINGGQRDRVGTFAEWERHWSREWTSIVGVRNDVVWMNTGNVQGYNATYIDAAAFNALDKARTDVNFDGSALVRYEPNQLSNFELGFARKTRSPNLYERYAWSTGPMAANMIGWFGDGNGYVGDVDLKPEKAHTVSFTAGWHDPAQTIWSLKVSPYASYVQDYIDVDRCDTPTCLYSGTMGPRHPKPNNLTATSDFVALRFANHDATLYGVNVEGRLALWDNLSYGRGEFRGVLNYVRGERTDGINLYHVMPINAKLALDHRLGGWTNSVELQLVGAKDQVSQVHNETTTPDYALVNLRTGYEWQRVKVEVGVDNLFNKTYYLPLGGAYLVDAGMAGGTWGLNVLGPGRSINGRLSVTF